jgi:hypothetical protein
MRNIITIAAAGLLAAAALPAFASSDDDYKCRAAGGQRMSVQDITSRVTGMGYDVRKVETDDGCYEVYAIDKGGARVELKLDPVSGRVVKTERGS